MRYYDNKNICAWLLYKMQGSSFQMVNVSCSQQLYVSIGIRIERVQNLVERVSFLRQNGCSLSPAP